MYENYSRSLICISVYYTSVAFFCTRHHSGMYSGGISSEQLLTALLPEETSCQNRRAGLALAAGVKAVKLIQMLEAVLAPPCQ